MVVNFVLIVFKFCRLYKSAARESVVTYWSVLSLVKNWAMIEKCSAEHIAQIIAWYLAENVSWYLTENASWYLAENFKNSSLRISTNFSRQKKIKNNCHLRGVKVISWKRESFYPQKRVRGERQRKRNGSMWGFTTQNKLVLDIF